MTRTQDAPGLRTLSSCTVSAEFASVVKSALRRSRQERYSSADMMKQDLLRCRDLNSQVPQHWNRTDTPWSEVHTVNIDPQEAIYREIEQLVMESCRDLDIKIIKIERVQNLYQWVLYQTKKVAMGARGDDLRLFHGTTEGSISMINKYSFNRSYCGKNANVYGQGVYFARS